MKYLKMHINGIMQHYPALSSVSTAPSSTYYRTEKVPTINAVVGMIGAALGYNRDSREIAELPNKITLKYQIVKIGSTFTDFQVVKPEEGKVFTKVGGGTKDDGIIKTVEYLQDAEFYVYIGGDEGFLRDIYEGFLNPVYVPYIGKKSCFFSEEIVEEEFKLVDEEELEYVHDCP